MAALVPERKPAVVAGRELLYRDCAAASKTYHAAFNILQKDL